MTATIDRPVLDHRRGIDEPHPQSRVQVRREDVLAILDRVPNLSTLSPDELRRIKAELGLVHAAITGLNE